MSFRTQKLNTNWLKPCGKSIFHITQSLEIGFRYSFPSFFLCWLQFWTYSPSRVVKWSTEAPDLDYISLTTKRMNVAPSQGLHQNSQGWLLLDSLNHMPTYEPIITVTVWNRMIHQAWITGPPLMLRAGLSPPQATRTEIGGGVVLQKKIAWVLPPEEGRLEVCQGNQQISTNCLLWLKRLLQEGWGRVLSTSGDIQTGWMTPMNPAQ